MSSIIERLNDFVARSFIGRHFRLEGSGVPKERKGARFSVELRGGLATFVTLAYIISTNALILAECGGTCECDREKWGPTCNGDHEYARCLQGLKMDLITGTCAISCIGCALMGTFANLPLALAPGMGLNAYFAYTVVGYHGSGSVEYRNAIAAVCIEGVIFLVLSIVGLRQWFARMIPASLKTATGAGIGIYLAFIGLQSSAGIGLITQSDSTLVELGGCPPDARDATNHCLYGHLSGAPTWLGILGLFIISTLVLYQVRGAILIGIMVVAILSWPRGTPMTYFPYTDAGDQAFDFFKKVVTFHPIESTLMQFHWDLSHSDVWIALITFLYVDILDCTGTMFSMAKFGGYMNEKTQDFEGSSFAFLCDASSIIIGSFFGLAPLSTMIESGAGIAEGAKTGISAVFVAFMFFISLFFAPVFASFPPWATGPALISVGAMMLKSVLNINWDYIGDSVPAFLTIIMIPFGYSIGYGLISGIVMYIAINGTVWAVEKATCGRIVPADKHKKEPWANFHFEEGSNGILPPWLRRLLRIRNGNRKAMLDECDDVEMAKQEMPVLDVETASADRDLSSLPSLALPKENNSVVRDVVNSKE